MWLPDSKDSEYLAQNTLQEAASPGSLVRITQPKQSDNCLRAADYAPYLVRLPPIRALFSGPRAENGSAKSVDAVVLAGPAPGFAPEGVPPHAPDEEAPRRSSHA